MKFPYTFLTRLFIISALCLSCTNSLAAKKSKVEHFHDALLDRDQQKALTLMPSGLNVQHRNPNGSTLLHWAAELSLPTVTQALIDAKVNVNSIDNLGFTPLMFAVANIRANKWERANTVRILLHAGASINHQENKGGTALHIALECNLIDIAKLLLERGADVNKATQKGHRPLLIAAVYGNAATIALLLAHGALIDQQDDAGNSALHAAIASPENSSTKKLGRIDVFSALLAAGADVNLKSNDGVTPLHEAARSGNSFIIQALLKAGAAVNEKDNDNRSPLCYAVSANNAQAISLLVKAGALVNHPELNGHTPLVLAVVWESIESVKALLAAGANPNAVNSVHATPLHWAAAKSKNTSLNSQEILTSLLAADADINAQTLHNETPLLVATLTNNIPAAKTLIIAGADTTIRTIQGETVFDIIPQGYTKESWTQFINECVAEAQIKKL